MEVCPVCGNEVAIDAATCPFCGATIYRETGNGRKSAPLSRTVNLKQGLPVVDVALQRMNGELALAEALGIRVLIFIHGYGSSGKGGRIRDECRKVLGEMVHHRRLRTVIAGEELHRRTGVGKMLLRRFPLLAEDCATVFNNPGVTVAVL